MFYQFQVCDRVLRRLCNLRIDHPGRSRVTPRIVIAEVLAIFPIWPAFENLRLVSIFHFFMFIGTHLEVELPK